jgi:XTP/dITP diphosphohydrolase
MTSLIFATHNSNKSKEIASLLPDTFQVYNLSDLNYLYEIPETKNTLEGNAILKAQTIFDIFHQPVFSDDSGLEVEALNGAPGVFSARYAGKPRDDKKNMDLLITNLKDKSNLNARFRTVIAFHDTQQIHLFEGIVKGTITLQPRGNMGFGYDPIFVPDGQFKTFAEMSLEQKNMFSHRSKAFQQLISFILKYK